MDERISFSGYTTGFEELELIHPNRKRENRGSRIQYRPVPRQGIKLLPLEGAPPFAKEQKGQSRIGSFDSGRCDQISQLENIQPLSKITRQIRNLVGPLDIIPYSCEAPPLDRDLNVVLEQLSSQEGEESEGYEEDDQDILTAGLLTQESPEYGLPPADEHKTAKLTGDIFSGFRSLRTEIHSVAPEPNMTSDADDSFDNDAQNATDIPGQLKTVSDRPHSNVPKSDALGLGEPIVLRGQVRKILLDPKNLPRFQNPRLAVGGTTAGRISFMQRQRSRADVQSVPPAAERFMHRDRSNMSLISSESNARLSVSSRPPIASSTDRFSTTSRAPRIGSSVVVADRASSSLPPKLTPRVPYEVETIWNEMKSASRQ
ncbi:hypothetical protein BJ742DRAFT_769939 [Cladochytrium replicatum]|nr:hypothetical protein BJ742DRAFT_769939 [Cladochytrium replicatum]